VLPSGFLTAVDNQILLCGADAAMVEQNCGL
jgi:hypothetical protein